MFEDRLKKLRQEKKLNMKQTAQQLGIPYTTYVGYEKNEREPNSEVLLTIAAFFGCSIDYLLGREVKNKDKESNVIMLSDDCIRMIPVFESVSAGFGAYASSSILEYLPCYITSDSEAEETMCIKVTGDSMYPKIENGDIIQVRKQSSVDSGQIAVVLLDGDQGLVKKVIYGETWVELHSINPEYPVKRFDGADVQRLKVVGLVRKIIKTV